MAERLTPPLEAMTDRSEHDLFFRVWQHALGPAPESRDQTDAWLRAFGGQTKWLPDISWIWWLEQYRPLNGVDIDRVKNFLSLIIGLLGDRSPKGEAVGYAREMAEYLDHR